MKQVQSIMTKLDDNGDGTISWKEMKEKWSIEHWNIYSLLWVKVSKNINIFFKSLIFYVLDNLQVKK